MNRSLLKALLENRQFADEASLDEINSLAELHPYCSSFQVLRAIGARQFGRLEAKSELNHASVYINDRAKLYTYTVRAKLLEQIAHTEQIVADEPASGVGSAKVPPASAPFAVVRNHEEVQGQLVESEVQGSPSHIGEAQDQSINAAPLEAHILIEAMGHLGEMEVASSLSANPGYASSSGNDDKEAAIESAPLETFQYSNFTQWLLNKREASGKAVETKSQVAQLIIDKFIQESPQITPAKAAFFSPSQMGKLSLVEDESFISETLAKIYERQGDFKKAARAYKQLGLKYPEKRTYFAALEKRAESQHKN